MRARWILTVGLLGCSGEPTPADAPATAAPASARPAEPASGAPASTAPSTLAPSTRAAPATQAAPATSAAPAPPALRAAWRDSIKYRSAFKAMVQNIDGLKADKARMARLARETRMFEVVPVAPRPAEDAEALRKALAFHADGLGLADVDLDLRTNLPARPPVARVSHSDGISYSPEQLMGRHRITVRFRRRADAERWVRGLKQLPRPPLIERVRTAKGKTVVKGYAPYFTALVPATVVRPRPPVEAIIQRAGGADTGTALKLRANYAEVDALQPQIEIAFALEAESKLTTSRFSHFTAHAKALEQMSWLALTGRAPREGHDHGAPKKQKK